MVLYQSLPCRQLASSNPASAKLLLIGYPHMVCGIGCLNGHSSAALTLIGTEDFRGELVDANVVSRRFICLTRDTLQLKNRGSHMGGANDMRSLRRAIPAAWQSRARDYLFHPTQTIEPQPDGIAARQDFYPQARIFAPGLWLVWRLPESRRDEPCQSHACLSHGIDNEVLLQPRMA